MAKLLNLQGILAGIAAVVLAPFTFGASLLFLGVVSAASFAGANAMTASGARKKARAQAQRLRSTVESRAFSISENITGTSEYIPIIYGTSRIGGLRTYLNTFGEFLYMIIVFSEGPVSGIKQIYINNVPIGFDRFNGKVSFYPKNGYDTDVWPPGVIGNFPGVFSTMQYPGLCAVAMVFARDSALFPGIPTVTADIEGKLLLDVRSGVTRYSNNPALCLYDYLTNTRYGCSVPAIRVNVPSFSSAANYCDTTVARADGQRRHRYDCNGFVRTGEPLITGIEDILTSCNAVLFYSNGQYQLKILRPEVPVYVVGDSSILGGLTVTRAGTQTKRNKIKSQFLDPRASWQPNVINVSDPDYLAQDNGIESSEELDLAMVSGWEQARALGKLALRQSRADTQVSFKTTHQAIQYQVGDVIELSTAQLGWNERDFRVVSLGLAPDGTIDVGLSRYDATVFSGADIDDEAQPSDPDTNFTVISTVAPPTNLSLGVLVAIRNGQPNYTAQVLWVASPSPLVTGYEVQFRQTGDGVWQPAGSTGLTSMRIPGITDNPLYVRVRAVNYFSFASAWLEGSLSDFGIGGLLGTAAASVTFHPTFPGTVSGFVVLDQALTLDGVGLFDDEPGQFDAAPGLFDLAGGSYVTSATYTPAATGNAIIDLTTVQTARLALELEAMITSYAIPAVSGELITLTPQVATTNDDPAAMPTWSGWLPIVDGVFTTTARAFKFRLVAASTNNQTTVFVSRFAVRAFV